MVIRKNEKAFFFADSPMRELINHLDLNILVGGVATKDNHYIIHPFSADPFFRFYYVVNGKVNLIFSDGKCSLKPGMMYLIPANQPFRYSVASNFTHYWLHFCSSQLEKISHFQHVAELKAPAGMDSQMKNLIRYAKIGDGVEALLGADVILRNILLLFLVSMPKGDFEKINKLGQYSHVIEYINRNVKKNLMVKDLAKIAGMNYNDFSAGFHSTFGITPKQYICKRRIDIAKNLLLSSDMNIKQVSEYVGYDNEFFFYRLFKKYTRQTPKYYRNNNYMG